MGFRKRRYRRRRRIPRSVVPSTKLVSVKAVDYQDLVDASTGTLVSKHFYLNAITDPFATHGTGRPFYYNTMKAVYRSAIVVGSKLTVTYHLTGTATTTAVMVGLYRPPYDSTATLNPNSWEFYREVPFQGRQRILTTEADAVTLMMQTSCKKYFGVQSMRDNSEFIADIENNTDCTKLGYYTIWMQVIDQAAGHGTITVQCHCTMEYSVLLMHPITVARS